MTHNDLQNELNAHLDHVGIAVRDLQNSASKYEVLGLSISEREVVEEQKVEVVMLPAGETRIELLCPTSDDSPVAKFIERNGEGLHHIALRVPDIRLTLAKCKAMEIRAIDQEPRIGAGGSLIAFLHPKSTGGVLIELTQSKI